MISPGTDIGSVTRRAETAMRVSRSRIGTGASAADRADSADRRRRVAAALRGAFAACPPSRVDVAPGRSRRVIRVKNSPVRVSNSPVQAPKSAGPTTPVESSARSAGAATSYGSAASGVWIGSVSAACSLNPAGSGVSGPVCTRSRVTGTASLSTDTGQWYARNNPGDHLTRELDTPHCH
ncbi:Uncharacterised protein [Mycobacteroides abscessus subsp. abscessus]|nr:Uncharacterised protein [Mycobacteroides abscessus subsp. abscessus]